MQVKFAVVLAAVTDHLPQLRSRDYFWNDYGVTRDVAKVVGIEGPTGGYHDQSDWRRLTSQVERALARLAEEGTLVRVTPKESGPDGRSHRFTRYYFPESYARIKAAHDEEVTTVKAANDRWQLVTARLSAVLGRDIGTTGHRPQLTVEEFELIAEILEGRK